MSTFRDRYLENIVGGFILASGLAFASLVLFSITGGGWFTPWNYYQLELEHGTGLTPGVEVTVAGMTVGHVERVTLTPERKVRLVLAVDKAYEDHVRADSIGRVSFTMAGKVVIIEEGQSDTLLANGGQLAGGDHYDPLLALEKMDLVGNLKRIERILEDVNELASQLQLGDGRLPEAIDNVTALLGDLQAGKGTMGRALKDEKMADAVVAVVHDVDKMAAQLEKTAIRLEQTSAELEKASGSVVEGVGHIEHAAKSLDRTADSVGNAADRLVGSTERLDDALAELGETMKAIQRLPLVRGQIKKVREEEKGGGQ